MRRFGRGVVGLVVVLTLVGCGQSDFVLEKLDPGSECPSGGVRVTRSGQAPQVVCNGASGKNGNDGRDGTNAVNQLVTHSKIDAGDARCPGGGLLVTIGDDENADGELQPAEVTSSSALCNGDPGERIADMTPPAGPTGFGFIRVNGGSGTVPTGGYGGSVSISILSGTNGGHAKVWSTGTNEIVIGERDAGVPDLGERPLIVTSNLVVPRGASEWFDAGVVFVDDVGLFVSGGASAAPQRVTGISVAANATLTLPGLDAWTSNIMSGCIVHGRVESSDMERTLGLACRTILLGSTSVIAGPSVTLRASGGVRALGLIQSSADARHAAGDISIFASWIHAAGRIEAIGSGSFAGAVYGGDVRMYADDEVINEARIDTRGGAGTSTRSGGSGGEILIHVGGEFGIGTRLINTGQLIASGGDNPSPCPSCGVASRGGKITLSTAGCPIVSSGSMTTRGGADFGFQGTGGPGGSILITQGAFDHPSVGDGIQLSGEWDASGGDGREGGSGGRVEVVMTGNSAPGSEIRLLGIRAIEANGGAGGQGGIGGTISIQQFARSSAENVAIGPAGSVLVSSSLSAEGGLSTAAPQTGGRGGRVTLSTQTEVFNQSRDFEQIHLLGAVSVRGGSGTTGGDAGGLIITSLGRVLAWGNVTATGGTAVGDPNLPADRYWGGRGGELYLGSLRGELDHRGVIDGSGGDGLQNVGRRNEALGGQIILRALKVTESGTLKARGGGGPATSFGGNGGSVTIQSTAATTSITVPAPASIDVSSGDGLKGLAGSVVVDGADVTSQWKH